MERVAAKAGIATCWAPVRMATVKGFPRSRLRWMFSTSTVASSTNIPMAKDNPPRVMIFKVLPVSFSPMMPTRMDKGMEVHTMITLRQLPKKNKIISETSIEAMMASCSTLSMELFTNTDWSKSIFNSNPLGAASLIIGSMSLAASTTAKVEAPALRKITI